MKVIKLITLPFMLLPIFLIAGYAWLCGLMAEGYTLRQVYLIGVKNYLND